MKNITCNSPDDVIRFINGLPNNYIYRGQANSKWTLQSTLERVLGSKYKNNSATFEQMSINTFKNKFHLYDKINKIPETKLEWLSIMQHYGVPTRLLDFTTSPYVALYFAIESCSKNESDHFSIYSIDYRDLMKKTLEFLRKTDKQFNTDYNDVNSNQDQIFENTIDRYNFEMLWVTEPQTANLRLDHQAGCFLFSSTTQKTYEELLNTEIYKDVDAIKIDISCTIWDNIFTLLQRANITSKTIYGDLVGLSMSIKMMMKAYS